MRFAIGFLSIVTTIGCQTPKNVGSKSLDDENEPKGPLANEYWAAYQIDLPAKPTCEAGSELTSLTLAKTDATFTIKPQEANGSPRFEAPGAPFTATTRLDVCVGQDDRATLRQIVQRNEVPPQFANGQPPDYLLIVPHPKAVVQGLEGALFGNTEDLLIVMPFGWGDGFVMRGFRQDDKQYVYMAHTREQDGRDIAESFVGGILRIGDPFVDVDPDACPPSTKLNTERFAVRTPQGKVTISRKICEWIEQGTFHHIWKEVTIKDSGAPGEAKDREFKIVRGASVAGHAYDDNTLHHNVCTSYAFKLPHATYGQTSFNRPGNNGAQASGCDGLVDGAPSISDIPPSTSSRAIFVFKYGSNEAKTLTDPQIDIID